MNMRPRIILADDHNVVSAGIRKILEPEFDLVCVVEDGRSLVDAAERLQPDLAIVDISLPVMNGFEAARHIRKVAPHTRIVFMTMHSDPDYVKEAVQLGALGYILKRCAASELVLAIQEALKGRRYVTPLASKEGGHDPGKPLVGASVADLTERQREILRFVGEGMSNKELAGALKISLKTVEFHKSNLRQKLGLHTTADLVRHAIQTGVTAL